MKGIRLAEGLPLLPDNAATQVYSFMGRRGSGKTYGAGRLVEQLLEHGDQVCVVDPVGTWWGLRFATDGKKPSGFEIPVFGGWHADLPLLPTAGKVFADLVATRSTSIVLDVSDMHLAEQRRFVGDFATELFQAKKRNRSPLHVVLEECQEFAPQNAQGDVARMLGAVQRLYKLGRNFGIGGSLLSQRPQAVSKEVLNQSEVMVACQLTGPQERKAIQLWVQEVGASDREIADELPGLPTGTALIWSPSWLKTFGKHKILEKRTYDASATPEARQADAGRKLPPIDLKEVEAAMASTVEEARAADPKTLRAEVARLRAELAKAGKGPAPKVAAPVQVERVPAALKRTLAVLGKQSERLTGEAARLAKGAADLATAIEAASREAALPPVTQGAPIELKGQTVRPYIVPGIAPGLVQKRIERLAKQADPPAEDWRPGGGALRMLQAIASSLAVGLTWRQVATLARMKATGGSFGTYKSALRTHGCVEERGDLVYLTDLGRALAGEVEAPRTGAELVRFWQEKLQGKAKQMLEVVVGCGPGASITRARLAEEVGMEAGGGSFGTYLSALRSNGLVEDRDGGLAPAEVFFR